LRFVSDVISCNGCCFLSSILLFTFEKTYSNTLYSTHKNTVYILQVDDFSYCSPMIICILVLQ